eukprot:171808-Pyramimonas_sp.AAC.1
MTDGAAGSEYSPTPTQEIVREPGVEDDVLVPIDEKNALCAPLDWGGGCPPCSNDCRIRWG